MLLPIMKNRNQFKYVSVDNLIVRSTNNKAFLETKQTTRETQIKVVRVDW